ncbi:MAG: hypothetical protein WKF94_17505 [Solirubrobacteraceae bacterium]
MARSVHVRLDDASEDALRLVRSTTGGNDSDAVRTSLREAAERRRTRSALRAEVERLMADPVDRSESRAIMKELDALQPDFVD